MSILGKYVSLQKSINDLFIPYRCGAGPLRAGWSEGFPLAGLFHPWAQWDLGLDTLENSSRRAVAVVVALERARPSCKGFQESLLQVDFPPTGRLASYR